MTSAPEILDSSDGQEMPPPRRRGPGRRGWLLIGAVVAVAVVAGGAWLVYRMFFATGPQPSEALPASTIGYVSIDLDPSGKQKLAALHTLEKFPAIKKELDLDSKTDLRKTIFEAIQDDAGACPSIDFDDDVEPWLGDRFALAAVDLGKAQPAVVGVVQVTDGDGAEDGLGKIESCAKEESGASDVFGWSISEDGDWAVIAETDKIAEEVVSDAAEHPLAEDADFKKWTEAAGDPGMVTAYASPKAGRALADMFGGMVADAGRSAGVSDQDLRRMTASLRKFGGAALTIRFNDEGLELETAVDATFGGSTKVSLGGGEAGDDVVATLPEDTAAALGIGFPEGWAKATLDQIRGYAGARQTVDRALRELRSTTGLTVPGGLERLLGRSAALSVGPGIDPETAEGPDDVPLAVSVLGDPRQVTQELDRIRARVGGDVRPFLVSDVTGAGVVVSPSDPYRKRIVSGQGGDLGDSERFRDAVAHADTAGMVLYIDFDAFDKMVKSLGGAEATENFTPLSALGFSSWRDGDVAHGRLRVTTD